MSSLTEKQQETLAKLRALPTEQLSAKQARKLEMLMSKSSDAASDRSVAKTLPPPSKVGLSREERRELTKRKLEAQAQAASAAPAATDKAAMAADAATATAPITEKAAAKAGLSREERRELTKRKLEAQAVEVAEAAEKVAAKQAAEKAAAAASAAKAAAAAAKEVASESARTPKQSRSGGGAYAVGPCSEQGHWGDDGEWVYPAERTLKCASCAVDFKFTGEEQAWYAQRSLYAPSRCAECLAAKKQRKEEKRESGRSGEGRCFACGEFGHLSSRCPNPQRPPGENERKACYICGSLEHLSRNCPNAAKAAKKQSGCFTCGSNEHMSRECPQRPPPLCHNCGETGHASKGCPLPVRTSGVCFAFQKAQCFRKKCPFSH
jgi:cellular nucleic acid-binding protein